MSPAVRAAYYHTGHAAGLSDEAIEAAIAEADRVDAYLTAGKCPSCGQIIGRRKDPRQAGSTSLRGVWFNYLCTCGYHCDRVEPERDVPS